MRSASCVLRLASCVLQPEASPCGGGTGGLGARPVEVASDPGGEIVGRALLQPTLLEDVARDQPIYAQEAFGPVAVLSRFERFDDALAEVNDSVFGLQAGVFTRDLFHAQRAWDELEVGGVVVGDVPSWRVDTMPYGGVKDSGLGREGVRFAIEDMTEIRLLVTRTPPELDDREAART